MCPRKCTPQAHTQDFDVAQPVDFQDSILAPYI